MWSPTISPVPLPQGKYLTICPNPFEHHSVCTQLWMFNYERYEASSSLKRTNNGEVISNLTGNLGEQETREAKRSDFLKRKGHLTIRNTTKDIVQMKRLV